MAQDTGLVSGFQGVGLSSVGVESFCRDVGQNIVMKKKRENWSYSGRVQVCGQQLNCIS